jgi:hypothetical protein
MSQNRLLWHGLMEPWMKHRDKRTSITRYSSSKKMNEEIFPNPSSPSKYALEIAESRLSIDTSLDDMVDVSRSLPSTEPATSQSIDNHYYRRSGSIWRRCRQISCFCSTRSLIIASLICLSSLTVVIVLSWIVYLPRYIDILALSSSSAELPHQLLFQNFLSSSLSSNTSTSTACIDSEHIFTSLTPIVKQINMFNILVYIVYHDEKSRLKAQDFSRQHPEWTKSVMIRSSKFFETIFYRDILPFEYNEWMNKDYVGMISYKAVDISINNMSFKAIDIPYILALSYNVSTVSTAIAQSRPAQHYDIIPLLQGVDMQLMSQAVQGHGPQFQRAWDSLLMALEYNQSLIQSADRLAPFFRNSFLGRPSLMRDYCIFINRAIDLALYNETVRQLLGVNANYDATKLSVAQLIFQSNHYELHPFIFERLPVFYFHAIQAKVFRYPNLRSSKRSKSKHSWRLGKLIK